MKFEIRILSLILSAIILIGTLSSCKKGENGGNTEENVSKTESASVTLIGEDKNDFVLIKPKKPTEVEQMTANNLFVALMNTFPDTFDKKIKDDFVRDLEANESYESENFEILIGETNRKESREILDALSNDEYIIKFTGKKLVLLGKADYATEAAVEKFIEEFVTKSDGKTLEIPDNLEIKGKKSPRGFELHEKASLRIMSWNLGCEVGKVADCVKVLERYMPDIICLQEANKAIHRKVISELPSRYGTATQKHSGTSTYVYTPIIYNTKVFRLVESGVEWLDGRYTGTNTKSVARAVFVEIESGVKFAVINFHGAVCSASYKGYENMSSAERAKVAAAWRLDNARQVIDIKNDIVKRHGEIQIMLTGDMNFNKDSEPYRKLIGDGFLDAEFTASENRETGYATYFAYGSTAFPLGLSIDRIMQVNGVEFIQHAIVRDKEVLTASDHCPVFADINIKK